jgi:HK97 gp10 family phage protein
MAQPVRVDGQAVRNLERHPDVTAALNSLGRQIAQTAAASAPRRTGRGAASIHHELGQDERGPRIRVSWSKDAYYLMFHELGTSEMRARPFLRPALNRRYTI